MTTSLKVTRNLLAAFAFVLLGLGYSPIRAAAQSVIVCVDDGTCAACSDGTCTAACCGSCDEIIIECGN